MFVTEGALSKEKDHIEGFAPEVAWVTRSGDTELNEPIAIRPTSETIMYPSYAKWIQSYRELPLLLNQWSNVVRWEFKHPTPFIRSREFLWQEGHTAHESLEEAEQMTHKILQIYADCYRDVLALPVIPGLKSQSEKFAGADYTTTVELIVPQNGRAIQGATSHNLGQNFAKMFEIQFEDKHSQKQFVHQTSWGLSTRSIGAMIMIHGDDNGLILPPAVAETQVVIVPIKNKGIEEELFKQRYENIYQQLKSSGIRVVLDDRENYKPGWKFNHWELKGVPIRIELGENDYRNNQVTVVRRDTGVKELISNDSLNQTISQKLNTVQQDMYEKSLEIRNQRITMVQNWSDFMDQINKRNSVLAPWCNSQDCEQNVKRQSKQDSDVGGEDHDEMMLTGQAKTMCLPFENNKDFKNQYSDCKCFYCKQPAQVIALWGRSY
eukprot:403360196